MDSDSRRALAELLRVRATAALGTLHDGAPAVSMVPFVFSAAHGLFVIHVSGLSQHTRDMKVDPRVSLMVVEAEGGGQLAQALARVTVQGEAWEVETSAALHAQARSAYLTRFPDASSLVELPGFSFFAIRPVGARFVGGFARAFSVSPEELVAAVGEA